MSYKRNKTRYKNKGKIILYIIHGVFIKDYFGNTVPKIFTKDEYDKYYKKIGGLNYGKQ